MPSYLQTGVRTCPKCKRETKKIKCDNCDAKTKPSGKWSVVFDLQTDDTRKQKKLSGYETRREAELAYIGYKGTYKPSKQKKEIFATVFLRYFSYQATRTKESTRVDIEKCFNLHILPYFGSLVIDEIKTKDIIEWQALISVKQSGARTKNKKLLSSKYKDNILTYLKMFFNYCVDIEEIIAHSPVKKQLKFIDTKIKDEMLIYSPEEYSQFKSVINNEEDALIFDLLYYTGMRKGELIALKWQDVKNNILSITKTYSRKTNNGKWKLTPPKSQNSIRDVLLPEFIIYELRNLKIKKQAQETDFIIGSELPSNEKYLDTIRDRYTKAAQIKRIRIHDFRHSHVSYLISENIDIMTIAKRVGDNVETILSTYAHLMPNKQLELINKLNKIGGIIANKKIS